MAGTLIGFGVELAINILLNGHVIKLPFENKYLYPHPLGHILRHSQLWKEGGAGRAVLGGMIIVHSIHV